MPPSAQVGAEPDADASPTEDAITGASMAGTMAPQSPRTEPGAQSCHGDLPLPRKLVLLAPTQWDQDPFNVLQRGNPLRRPPAVVSLPRQEAAVNDQSCADTGGMIGTAWGDGDDEGP